MDEPMREADDGPHLGSGASASRQYKVPGASAPTCNIARIWASMFRWILEARSDFSTFLHSVICNKPSLEEGTAFSIWPMPPPYPQWMRPGNACDKRGAEGTMEKQKALNLIVLNLSWQHLGQPSRAPPSLRLGRKLNGRQWAVVRRFDEMLDALLLAGDIGPAEMGRTAAKMEGLEGILQSLHAFAKAAGLDAIAQGSLLRTDAREPNQAPSLRPGALDDAGEVVGVYRGEELINAKDIEPSRLSFPQEKPEFDPTPFLDEQHRQCYDNPTSLAVETEVVEPPPRVQIKASKQQSKDLLRFLDKHKRLTLAPEQKVRADRCCGAFSLLKDSHKDRLIIDARPANAVEPTLSSFTKTLGSISALLQLEMLPGHKLYMSGTDLKDYYYCFAVSPARSLRNALRIPIDQQFARELSCYDEKLHGTGKLYPCLFTLAMGDCNAVELGQMSHINLGISARAFSPHELLGVHSRAPRGKIAAGIVIDDVLIAEQLTPEAATSIVTEGEYRLNLLCERYQVEGLCAHPAKTFRKKESADVWGVSIDGDRGFCRSSPRRVIPLISATARTARIGFATVGFLEVLSGAWVSVLQVRRRMLSLLQLIYVAQIGRPRNSIIKLSPGLVAELWSLVILAPLATADLRAQTEPTVFLTDASNDSIAAVQSQVPLPFARELHRHCLSKGAWTKLLSPWHAFLREHDELGADEEIPSGAPLICHPLWVAVAEYLQFREKFCHQQHRKRHINLLEIEAVLKLEERIAERCHTLRLLIGSDSQVAIAALMKGRSASYRVNCILRKSLGIYLGAGLYESFGYLPSLVNVADDPTRKKEVRAAIGPKPRWLVEAEAGNFTLMDEWLGSLGYDPLEVAQLPFSPEFARRRAAVVEHVSHLRSVQKPERLKAFDEKCKTSSGAGKDTLCVSPSEGRDQKTDIREQEEPCEGHKIATRGKKFVEKEPTKAVVSFHESRVAPPASCSSATLREGAGFKQEWLGEGAERNSCSAGAKKLVMRENSRCPPLSAEARAALELLPKQQFFGMDGRRCSGKFHPLRKGFLDLYSGASGVARRLAKKYKTWVLTFDIDHSPVENLLDESVQRLVFQLMNLGCFLGVGAAPECGSFSRAVTPAVRDRDWPEGRPDISAAMREKVERGNRHASFVLDVVELAIQLLMGYWVENPDGSFLWLQPRWIASGLALMEASYRFDMCRFSALWRKRTRLATNTQLAGIRQLCLGGHEHIRLRGRSLHHKLNWTRVAQVYPKKLCSVVADALAAYAGLKPQNSSRRGLDISGCAKVNCRVGEASNPGPRRGVAERRRAEDLIDVALVEPTTQKLQHRVWLAFDTWLSATFSQAAVAEMFRCPSLVALVLQKYGVELFVRGSALYEFRHLLVIAQQQIPLIKPAINSAWQLLAKWEAIRPVTHRIPLPEVLFKAMISIAVLWGWMRWAATLTVAFEGIGRIGEAINALRRDLVLPSDSFDTEHLVAFLKIPKPKSRKRGRGRVQHLRIDNVAAVEFLELQFANLHPACKLFPMSAASFRSRWDKILDALQLPRADRPTPSSVRGGGAIAAYRRGETIQGIMWKMRIINQSTLESYLQETAADSLLARMSDPCRSRIRCAARFFPFAFQSPSR